MSASCKAAKDRAPYIRSAFVGLLLSTTLGGTAFAQQAQTKQTADIAASDTTEEQDATKQPSDIVVTGTATAQRKFDVSYAVTSLSNAAIRQLAPLSFADLLSQVPGILGTAGRSIPPMAGSSSRAMCSTAST